MLGIFRVLGLGLWRSASGGGTAPPVVSLTVWGVDTTVWSNTITIQGV